MKFVIGKTNVYPLTQKAPDEAFVVEATPFLHSRFGRQAVEEVDAVVFYINENNIFKWLHF